VRKHARLRFIHLALIFTVMAAMIGPMVFVPQGAAAKAAFNFSPKEGPPGTKVTVTVSGAPSDAKLTVEGNGKSLCNINVGKNGKGNCTFSAPKGSGSVKLVITGDKVGHSDIGTFNVTESNDGGNNGGNNRPDANGLLGCTIGVLKGAATSGAAKARLGVVEGAAGALLGCRGLTPQGQNLTPQEEALIKNLSCGFDTLGLVPATASAASAAALPVSAGLGARLFPIAGALLTGAQVGLCIAEKIDEAATADLIRRSGFNPHTIPTAEELGIPANTPLSTVPQQSTTVQPIPQNVPTVEDIQVEVRQGAPTFGDVLESVNSRTSAPSATMVQNQQSNIRTNQVCPNAPANGAGGCP
jgi:hypothetical protein